MAFVNISEDKVKVNSVSTYTQFQQMWDYANKYSSSVDTALNNLASIVGTFDPNTTIPDILVPSLDRPNFPSKPSWPPLDLDDGWPDTIPIPSEFEAYGNTDFEYVAPTPPNEIDSNFVWIGSEYTSDMWFDLFSKVHIDVINGGNGLTNPVYLAIVAREQFSRKDSQDKQYRKLLDSVGATGFNLASGQVAALQRDTATGIINSNQDALNNLLIKDFDLATENTRFAITTGTQLEQLLRTAYEASENRSFEAAKATKDYLLAVYKENIQLYLAKWEGIKADLEALKTKIEAITSKNKGIVDIFVGKASVFETQIKSITEKNKGKVDARSGEIGAYSAEVGAVSSELIALVEEMKAITEVSKLEVDAAINESRIDLDSYTAKSSLAEKVASEIAGVSAQALASALGGINASISNSYSGSESTNEAWQHGENLSESHSYSEE